MKKYFQFDELGTTYKKEFLAGLTTFLAMAYILFVNPQTLGLVGVKNLPEGITGMDPGAVFTATAVAAAIGSLIMGLIGKYPIGLAPGVGLSAFFAYNVLIGYGIPWQTALSGVLVSGIIFTILSLSGLREKIINSIPANLKQAVAVGIGFFIAFIGFKNSGIIISNPNTFVAIGDLTTPKVMLAIFGIVASIIFLTLNFQGGIFYGMILTAVVGIVTGLIPAPTAFNGILDTPPSLAPTFGQAFLHFGDLFSMNMLIVILTFLFVDFFDTAGTLVAVASQAGLMKDDKLPRAGRALLADSTATMAGAVVGTSTTTSYIESSAGVAAGGRSGFTAVVISGLFVLSLFFSPLLSVVTSEVTAPALVIVGILMSSNLRNIEWDRFEIAVPAFLTIICMPLTYSIATGIGMGFIFYPITMILKGRWKEINAVTYGMFGIFILYFIFLT